MKGAWPVFLDHRPPANRRPCPHPSGRRPRSQHQPTFLGAALSYVSYPFEYKTSHHLTDHDDWQCRVLDIGDSRSYVSQPIGGPGISTISYETGNREAADEFTCWCWSCLLVRHRSQVAEEKDGHTYGADCEG
jgi:hypothetical protein